MSTWRRCLRGRRGFTGSLLRRRCRGVSLLELVMAAVLMILLLTSLYTVLTLSLRSYALETNTAFLGQSALVGLSRIMGELPESNAASLRVDTSPPGIVFASPRRADGTLAFDVVGDLLWQKYVCYYVGTVDGTSVLLRREAPLVDYLGNPATAQAPPPAIPAIRNTAWFASQPTPCRPLAYNVTNLAVTGHNPVRITLTVNRSGLGKADEVQLVGGAWFRN